jgi:hypothetical protein
MVTRQAKLEMVTIEMVTVETVTIDAITIETVGILVCYVNILIITRHTKLMNNIA